MKLTKEFINRILLYILGLLFLAFSVAIAINSNLGISPVNSLPYAVSVILGANMSSCVIGVFGFYILLQVLILGRDFKWYNLFQLVFSTIFGYFVDFAKWVVGDFCIPTYLGQLTMLAISMVLIAIGIALYVDVKLIPMPMEGLSLACAGKLKMPFPKMKIIIDCTVVALAAILPLIFLGKLDGVREGTVLSALLVGRVIAWVQRFIQPLVDKICFPQKS